VIRQQPTTKSTEAPTTTPKSASPEDSAYGTKPETTLRCPKDLRMEAEQRMTEYEEDETLLPSSTLDLTKASTEAVAVSSSGNSEDDLFASSMTHSRASTLRQRRRTEGSDSRSQSENVVKGRKPRNEDGDFQHRDSSIRCSGCRKGFSWAGFSSKWSSASRDSSREPRKHEDEETDDDRRTLRRSKPGKPKSSARRRRNTTKRYKVDSIRRERRTNREGSRRSHRTKPESTTASSFESTSSYDEHDMKTTAVSRPKFDGATSFETFWAQFQNCVRHNR